MKNIYILFLLFFISNINAFSDINKNDLTMVEEEKSFWDTLLGDKSINNKNLLYASYIAYKDRLNDLSIETFQECKTSNSSNKVIVGIAEYYIAKNLFFIGKYEDAITQFAIVNNYDLAKYNYIKYAAILNTAIAYYQLGDEEKFRENLQKVISNDITGKYKKKALNLLSAAQ